MKEIHIWNFIYDHISKNEDVILVAVVSHGKGSPGKTGFKMALSKRGNSVGSIGGGIMEYNILKNNLSLLKRNVNVREIETLYHNKASGTKHQSGLICAGSQTNFTITLTKKNSVVVSKIIKSLKEQTPGKIILSMKGIEFQKVNGSFDETISFFDGNNWRYEQFTGGKNCALIIGGGHVGLAVSKVFSMLDFYVIVFDSRRDLKTMKEIDCADKKITGQYKNLGSIVPKNKNCYVIIVTTGFESDKEALKAVIPLNVKYIGLMGTKNKIRKIFNEAVKDGISKKQLQSVHAPIGIDIGSDTPEEIAVSIAAEIIREKNKSA